MSSLPAWRSIASCRTALSRKESQISTKYLRHTESKGKRDELLSSTGVRGKVQRRFSFDKFRRHQTVTSVLMSDSSSTSPDSEMKGRLSSSADIVTDQAVPEGHKGLHSFLYGDGGAEAHDSDSVYKVREGEDDGSAIVALGTYLEARDGEKPLGVYAVYDADKRVQYVGYSRNVVVALRGHLSAVGADRCSYVRVMVFANKAMATRSNLEAEAANWIAEADEPPPGNTVDQHLWDPANVTEAMSERELQAHEEKKLRMRKAMGENLHDDVSGETDDARTRRLKLLQAVEGDDWSEVIQEQTDATRGKQQPTGEGKITSPFANPQAPGLRAGPQGSMELDEEEALELTRDNVEAVLDEVRPYLIADGGNVEVAGVEGGVVAVRLQGACGTCPSAMTTLKFGIEENLRAKFKDNLREVVQVDKVDTSASVASVDAHLDMVRPAVENYGGSVRVLKVERGVCDVHYDGPEPIGMGVIAVIKDKFPDVQTVNLVNCDQTEATACDVDS